VAFIDYMTSKEAQSNFNTLLDSAQRNPIVIMRHKRDCVVVMSMANFEEYRKARAKALMDFCDATSAEAAENGMTQELLNDLLQS
jgi:PHD/YefM family antitoxin component YafN of YafNO toxin-antitoxin module